MTEEYNNNSEGVLGESDLVVAYMYHDQDTLQGPPHRAHFTIEDVSTYRGIEEREAHKIIVRSPPIPLKVALLLEGELEDRLHDAGMRHSNIFTLEKRVRDLFVEVCNTVQQDDA